MIALTPSFTLKIVPDTINSNQDPALNSWIDIFTRDWRHGLFHLAAQKNSHHDSQLNFWKDFADKFLTALCHIPEDIPFYTPTCPASSELSTLTAEAPPMPGGEYLDAHALCSIWTSLCNWITSQIESSGTLSAFLKKQAPKWNQVGRVWFHLAENRNDPEYPFAFMATFTSGFTPSGKLRHIPLRRALEIYSGKLNSPEEINRSNTGSRSHPNQKAAGTLITLLIPVNNAAKKLPWVKEMVDSGEIYNPVPWNPDNAHEFLVNANELETAGLSISIPDWWKKRPAPKVTVSIGNKAASILGTSALLDFTASIVIEGMEISEDELKQLLNSNANNGLLLFRGQWIEVDHESIGQAITQLEHLRKSADGGFISFAEGMRLLAGASHGLADNRRNSIDTDKINFTAGRNLESIISLMVDPSLRNCPEHEKFTTATLRPYQKDGLSWLHLQTNLGFGACLADDMGLGKTLQVLTLLSIIHNSKIHSSKIRKSKKTCSNTSSEKPSLAIVPASLLGTWKDEAKKFTPGLRLYFLHPSENRKGDFENIHEMNDTIFQEHDLFITTYAMSTKLKWLSEQQWRLLVLDEAQAIKNPEARQTKSVKNLKADARIAMTGTPVENHLVDLWSIFDFLNPGLLGTMGRFTRFIRELQQERHDHYRPLRQLISPYILRRLKTNPEIISDLPEKTEIKSFCNLTKTQARLYAKILGHLKSSLENSSGISRKGLILQTMLRLKQVCNHPSQLSGDNVYNHSESGKFARLSLICDEISQRQEKVLIFTQFREIIDPLAQHLKTVFGKSGLLLHGGTDIKSRKKIVDHFNTDEDSPFMILSLKAGGTGLNLTGANHVIHFDRWWNPAVENQATDRAFRIGQKKNVLVHKFITRGTLEERIDAMIEGKRELAEQIMHRNDEINITELSDRELIDLFSLDLEKALA
ncbi:MAG: ATP-dependent helicase [Candidatus Wallbacteria bacterium HGW-Wallbacteria-1]|uniref:ATP-dependent helicase n=1 Tax=Candidatus Wallbacteria bacterium HGW-Wallbacteria-1 TaxID=2013854 RepID=A0A2N1PN52_9BACT|nr:MAG: ATP-dependent helicase [Candidatus Wallbacteria bacterium HGW-Wallbacteria-1]